MIGSRSELVVVWRWSSSQLITVSSVQVVVASGEWCGLSRLTPHYSHLSPLLKLNVTGPQLPLNIAYKVMDLLWSTCAVGEESRWWEGESDALFRTAEWWTPQSQLGDDPLSDTVTAAGQSAGDMSIPGDHHPRLLALHSSLEVGQAVRTDKSFFIWIIVLRQQYKLNAGNSCTACCSGRRLGFQWISQDDIRANKVRFVRNVTNYKLCNREWEENQSNFAEFSESQSFTKRWIPRRWFWKSKEGI